MGCKNAVELELRVMVVLIHRLLFTSFWQMHAAKIQCVVVPVSMAATALLRAIAYHRFIIRQYRTPFELHFYCDNIDCENANV
jgi:hypothetical protein